jgi:sortase A
MRSRRKLRIALTATAIALAVGGIGLIAYPFATDLWAARIQSGLVDDLHAGPYRARQIEVGQALTRLEIPKLDVDVMVVEGTTPNALHAGAGHYVDTPLPGEAGNVGIAGHRTTYGKPFSRLDELRPGDKVVLTTPIGVNTYEIIWNPRAVGPWDWSIINNYPDHGRFLTLTSCHPEGSATQRLVTRARLVDTEPIVAAAPHGGRA